jgi:glycosyltransferase involved in cell wall biosynthesis
VYPNKKKRIWILVNSFGRGGAEMSLALLAKGLMENNCQVSYIALWQESKSYDFAWLESAGVDVIVLGGGHNKYISKVKQLRYLNRQQVPDFIFSAMLKADIIAGCISLFYGVGHLMSVRINPASFYNSNLKKIALAGILLFKKRILFISHRAVMEYQKTAIGKLVLRNKKTYVLHNPVELSYSIDRSVIKERLENRKKRFNESKGNVQLLLVSRMIQGKGILETLEQLKTTLRGSRFSMKIYGAGPLESAVKQYIIQEQLVSNVEFKGFSNNKKELFDTADILIFSSESEGFGRVPFEAMMHGCFVLCNKKSSIIEEVLGHSSPCWLDYSTSVDLPMGVKFFKDFNIDQCIEDVSALQYRLSLDRHTACFIQIMEQCLNKS